MGRHRRSEDPAEAVTQPLPVVRPGGGGGRHRSPHRGGRKKTPHPQALAAAAAKGGKGAPGRRAGLLGASAAVAMGAVAMVSGLLPGGVFPAGDGQPPGTGAGGQVRADSPPEATVPIAPAGPAPGAGARPQRPADRPAGDREEAVAQDGAMQQVEQVGFHEPARTAPGRDAGPRHAAAPASSPYAAPSGHPAGVPRPAAPAHGQHAPHAPHAHHSPAPDDDDEDVQPLRAAALADPHAAAAHLVVALVNAERARAGCRPLRADVRLNRLAQSFSDDMERRSFFDHTDPDGRTPWDRAARRGIKNLGGENIARGHPDPHTVMEAWMRSSGHRANILNCDYRSIGVGIRHGGNGPYWTQDFGY
ncbi:MULTISPECIES: CAP domain-containing protein [Streptomyces]|uniref:SCP domain-containing protein n=1 Tax=Streptomyces luteosporeus TaxID=173856 RepID=A0ABP6G762_9ACTN